MGRDSGGSSAFRGRVVGARSASELSEEVSYWLNTSRTYFRNNQAAEYLAARDRAGRLLVEMENRKLPTQRLREIYRRGGRS